MATAKPDRPESIHIQVFIGSLALVRIECSSCHEITSATLVSAAKGTATLECDGCGGHTTISVPLPSITEGSESVGSEPVGSCPKCGQPVSDGVTHCPACGLDREKFVGFSLGDPQELSRLTDGWQVVESRWQDDSAHEEFAANVVVSGSYGLAARCYRQAAADPARAQRAEKMLERMRSMATAALLSRKPKLVQEKEPYRGVLILLMVILFIGAGVGIVLMSGDSSGAGASHSEQK